MYNVQPLETTIHIQSLDGKPVGENVIMHQMVSLCIDTSALHNLKNKKKQEKNLPPCHSNKNLPITTSFWIFCFEQGIIA